MRANPSALPAVMLLIPINDHAWNRSEAEKGAWTFPSRVGKTVSGHGRPCGRCDKAVLLFFVLRVVTRVGVTLECAQCAQEESGLSMVALCTAIFYVQNVLYASKHKFCRMAVSTGPWRCTRHYTRTQDCEAMVRRSNKDGQAKGFGGWS